MERKMGEAVARVARKVNETVENKADFLDLADCKLMTFPIALYKVMRHVSEGIHLITLANNELKAVTSKFIITFSQLRAGLLLEQQALKRKEKKREGKGEERKRERNRSRHQVWGRVD